MLLRSARENSSLTWRDELLCLHTYFDCGVLTVVLNNSENVSVVVYVPDDTITVPRCEFAERAFIVDLIKRVAENWDVVRVGGDNFTEVIKVVRLLPAIRQINQDSIWLGTRVTLKQLEDSGVVVT